MEILVITWNFPPKRGGMERLLANLCAGLGRRHRLFVITAHAYITKGDDPRLFRPRHSGLLAFLIYAVCKGVMLLRRYPDIRVVVGGSVLVTPIVLVLARLFRRKSIIQCHGLDLLYARLTYQHLVVRWLRFADQVIANSGYTASLAKHKGVTEKSITIISPGVHWQRFVHAAKPDELKRERGLHGKKVILFVGRLARRKGVKEFIENSFVQILQECPETCFLIVGDNPTDSLTHRDDVRSEVDAAISACHLKDHVHWLGSLTDDELVKVYNLCDVVVLPSLEMKYDVEGFGIVALEAAAAGKPVVATRVGGIPDAVEDGVSGILVKAGDYEALSRALVKLLRDERSRRYMGEKGRSRVELQFNFDQIVTAYEQTLDDKYREFPGSSLRVIGDERKA